MLLDSNIETYGFSFSVLKNTSNFCNVVTEQRQNLWQVFPSCV